MARRAEQDFRAVGIQAFVDALATSDILVANVAEDGPFDAVVHVIVDDRPVTFLVEVKAYCTGDTARALIGQWPPSGRGHFPYLKEGPAFPTVVADRITAHARQLLTETSWSWLDRRGRLHLRAPAVRVDVDVPAPTAAPAAGPSGPAISGRGGISVAYWLCEHRDHSLSPTGQRVELGLAPSTISTAVNRLAQAGLVDDDGRGVFPELFWELAGAWRPERTWVATVPDPEAHRPVDPATPTWRRSGTAAAAAYGAPVVSGVGGSPELYVLGPVEVSVNVRRYGSAEPGMGAASLAVPPTTAVVRPPAAGEELIYVDGWPVAPRLAVALDLAQDRGRGREILEAWECEGDVWRQ